MSDPHPFLDLVFRRASAPVRGWFSAQLEALDKQRIRGAFAGAGRRLGDELVELNTDEQAMLLARGLPAPEGFRLNDLGRSLLLMRMCELVPLDEQVDVVEQLFKKGDNKEREALLKTLMLLPEPERFQLIAADACRSHVQSVFEAIACENAYPARFFSDLAFNQMVLKAFFTGVEVRRIVDLDQRLTPELSRMANDYASERRAAGRPVPPDIALVTKGEASH